MILAAGNFDVDVLIETTLDRLESQERTYYSADAAFDDEVRNDSVPHEYINTIAVSGMPLHRTILKIGASILQPRSTRRITQWHKINCYYVGRICHRG